MSKNEKYKSALSVNRGVEQPPSVNPSAGNSSRGNRIRKRMPVEEYREGILNRDISILSRSITLIESSLPADQEIARELVEQCNPHAGNSVRIGITGVPGVGKSSFIESFGKMLTGRGSRVAVLAVDPSSGLSKGSILGDKTRMEELSADPSAFIRPSPSGGSLGGVARKTRESIILCEAAGYDTVIVETVGVGQSETAVHSMVDFFLLLMLAGAGDELQGIKRGIMEMADMIVITKSDGNNVEKAETARSQYQGALQLFPPSSSGWVPRVSTCSSHSQTGLDTVDEAIREYLRFTRSTGFFRENRLTQSLYWMHESIEQQLRESFYNDPDVASMMEEIRQQVASGRLSSFTAAGMLLKIYRKRNREKT